jgi:two-component system, cell cycle sensor histidine kinase and response regulator CckA
MNVAEGRETGTQILIVEDEQIVALDIRMHLEKHGYTVAGCFAEAEAALEYLARNRENPPAVIIMDVNLAGELDGVSASAIVHEKYGIPVVFMTAYADEETLSRAKESEPFAYIVKPFEERQLRTAIEIALFRHRMLCAVRDREHLLLEVMKTIRSGIVVSDAEGGVQYANASAREITRAPLTAGTRMEDVLPVDTVRDVTGGSGGCVTWERMGSNGGTDTVEVRAHVLPAEPVRTVWVLTDLTARIARERALREQEEQLSYSRRMDAVGRMSAGLAHDFNNLVTVMLGYARLALEDVKDSNVPDTLGENVRGVYETARQSAELTRRLLTFSRIRVPRADWFVLDTLLEETNTMLTGVLPENVNLQTSLQSAGISVYADRSQIQQVVINLLLNARDAMPLGGMVFLSTELVRAEHPLRTHTRTLEPGDYVLLSVTDTGNGIEPEHLEHIFEPFFSTKDETRGSGFGLATVYSTVLESNGAVDVSSTLGHGTSFRVYLPAGSESGERVLSVSDRDERLDGSGLVLIVDQEGPVREMVVEIIGKHGYTPLSARSVGDGLLLLDHHPDCRVVVSDLSAPYYSTSGIVDLYRRHNPHAKLVFLLSGEEIEAGQDATLLKPFEPHQLLRLIQRLIQESPCT